jgi:hypothetical protein
MARILTSVIFNIIVALRPGLDQASVGRSSDVMIMAFNLQPEYKMAISMEGPLSKWTNVVKGWQYRWFVLDEAVGLLSYYTVSFEM